MQETNTKRIRQLFYDRLIGLLDEKGISKQKEQWEFLDVSKSTLLNWKNGASLPGHLDLVRIAHLLGCSVDYLIDETVTIKSAGADIQSAVKTTGLSEKAVEVLQACQNWGGGAAKILKTINAVIVSDIGLYQRKDGKWEQDRRPDPWNNLIGHDGNGACVQGSGLVAALQNNLEASVIYENEREKLDRLAKSNRDQNDWRELAMQDQRTTEAQIRLQNAGYCMMVYCTTATAEGQQYHERLKAEYMKGGRIDGEY